MAALATIRALIEEEMVQLVEEGCEVHVTAADVEKASSSADALLNLYAQLRAAKVRADFPYAEPSTLDAIRRDRPDGPRRMDARVPATRLADRIHGAWLGRVIGCMLGKPVEGREHDWIRAYLQNAEAWPLADYFPEESRGPDGRKAGLDVACCRGNVHAGMPDDDTNYTIIALRLIEEKGYAFTTADVGRLWLSLLPYNAACTAEHQAYTNLVNELPIAEVPLYLNPYREWIGAQIRADFFGYVTPGSPEHGAELAFRDAALSHVKNGIYGEMLMAATISAALVCDSVEDAIRIGLTEIPRRSRLAEAVRDVLDWHKQMPDWPQAFEAVMRTYGHYHRVHTINNAAIVLLGLLYGEGDFTRTIGIAVSCGLDTDCNGATAGSICGALIGADAIPSTWSWPLNDTLCSTVSGLAECRISDLAARTKRLLR